MNKINYKYQRAFFWFFTYFGVFLVILQFSIRGFSVRLFFLPSFRSTPAQFASAASCHTLPLVIGPNVTLLPPSVISKSATANLAVSQSAIVSEQMKLSFSWHVLEWIFLTGNSHFSATIFPYTFPASGSRHPTRDCRCQ